MRRILAHLLALALVLAALPALAQSTYLSVMVHNGGAREVLGQVKGPQPLARDLRVAPQELVFLADRNPAPHGQPATHRYRLAFVERASFAPLCRAEVEVVNRWETGPRLLACRARTQGPGCRAESERQGADLCAVTIWLAPPAAPAPAAPPRR
ncbi:MAG: hypothetical protein AB1814_12885 [Thermodesulfobacteriota bacterium]